MKNADKNIKEDILKTLETGESKEQAKAVLEYVDTIAKDLAEKFEEVKDSKDEEILRSAGFRVLTSKETKAYEKIIEAMKGERPQEALTGTDVVLPITTINLVFEDLEKEYPLLSEIDFRNVTGVTEFVVRTGEGQTSFWGDLCDAITRELANGFKKETVNLYKLSAFLPICKAMLDLGPTWLEAFIRTILLESLSMGLESAIVTGTGNKMPIGMDRDLSGAVVEGVYPQKEAIEFNSFDTDLLPNIATLSKNGTRKINGVLMVVNPVDYLTKVLPAIQYRTLNGDFVTTLRYPMKFVESTEVAVGKAILGIGKQYFLGLGSTKKIEHSDHYRFLDDERVYLTKMYATGKPKNNDSFIVLDISNLAPVTEI